ncbi:MAG: TIGR02300 family protein [Pseudomonadota bacterium]
MPKEEWGVKRVCPKTGKRFYDLNKSPIISPYTGEVVEIETPGSGGAKPRVVEKAKAEATTETEDLVIDEGDETLEDESSDVEIDDDLLDDDDDNDTVDLEEIADVPAEDDDS